MAVATEPDIRPGANRVPWWTKVFVLFHIVAITVWALPNQPEAAIQGKAPAYGSDKFLVWNHDVMKRSVMIQDYLFSTGFWQYWDMFSPNPANTDMYGSAEVTFKDGTTRPYAYPRIYDLSIKDKYLKERYRKFFERAHLEKYAYIWRVFARRIALENFKDPNNPPVKVVLIRHWLRVADPGQKQDADYSSYRYYTYAVEVERLKGELGYR